MQLELIVLIKEHVFLGQAINIRNVLERKNITRALRIPNLVLESWILVA